MGGKENPIPAKIVCVKNKENGKDWLAFICIDKDFPNFKGGWSVKAGKRTLTDHPVFNKIWSAGHQNLHIFYYTL